jgi:anti-sigma B factor antagonist
MQITEAEEDIFHVISVFGDVDAASSIILDKALENAVKQDKKFLLVDGSQINYISSAGLGVFMSYLQDFEEKEIHFSIYGLSDKVKNVFEILGLHELLNITSTKEEAKILEQ